ncbi:hypothetical protein GXW82_14175 [Streptacidiphilus sp. 4-A2]|nr:hypothetical protein [Streptacidiphilus sp. 4-A2]
MTAGDRRHPRERDLHERRDQRRREAASRAPRVGRRTGAAGSTCHSAAAPG